MEIDLTEGEKAGVFQQWRSDEKYTCGQQFLLLHFRLHLQTCEGGWVYVARHYFSFSVQIASLKASVFAENWHGHFTLSLSRKITLGGNWLWRLMECPLKLGRKREGRNTIRHSRWRKLTAGEQGDADSEHAHAGTLMELNSLWGTGCVVLQGAWKLAKEGRLYMFN